MCLKQCKNALEFATAIMAAQAQTRFALSQYLQPNRFSLIEIGVLFLMNTKVALSAIVLALSIVACNKQEAPAPAPAPVVVEPAAAPAPSSTTVVVEPSAAPAPEERSVGRPA